MPTPPVTGLVVVMDQAPIADTIGVAEVLIQEGFETLSLPAEHPALAELVSLYRSRVRLGLHGTGISSQLAQHLGIDFALLDFCETTSITALADLGVAVYPQAMTPNEIFAALALPVAGVQLYPADVLGPLMAERLASLGVIEQVVPRGGLIAYSAKQWLKAGAQAVCIDSQLLGDSLKGGDLAALRDRCRSYH